YGWDHNILFVFERDGALTVLIEWFERYPLTGDPGDPDRFHFPDRGLYPGESLRFLRDTGGRVTGADLSGIVFARRPGPAAGTFRIEPRLPVEELRRLADAGSPPVEDGDFLDSDLVRVPDLDPTIRLDVRYAGENNFMGTAFYQVADAFLQRPAAEALARAHAAFGDHGYGVIVHDGYRPWRVTKMFFDATPEHQRIFVADPASGSRHNRGAAVDIGLYDRATGEVQVFVSGYDEFSERAFPGYVGGTSEQRWLRELVRQVMEREGFDVYEHEWWHFDYGAWERYGIQNVPLHRIGEGDPAP
ncbi:MAG: M15 family metallopeptidase, partial [Acidobacteria bacterium]|nr:M15 family metallopeptidase [Acidobacteriota bacterium]